MDQPKPTFEGMLRLLFIYKSFKEIPRFNALVSKEVSKEAIAF